MPSVFSRYAEWAGHIVEQVERIEAYVGAPPDVALIEDARTADAIERCLERISEATARLDRAGVDLANLEPKVNWRAIRGFGNRLRHEYDNLDRDVVSDSLHRLANLKEAALRLQARFDPDQPNTRPMA